MIHLDTHIALWLAERRDKKLSASARRLVAREPIGLSPVVLIELDMLYERGRTHATGDTMLEALQTDLQVSLSRPALLDVVIKARSFGWTRDLYDQMIVANAMVEGAKLITADELILANFVDAVW